MMKQLLTIFILVFGLSAANAATWYVATSGSDANSGTNLSDAKLTVNGAIAVASDGDVIRVANGTYASITHVTKRVTIVGESNHVTTGAIFTNTIFVSATGGSASNRVIIDNICARNGTVTGSNSASIFVRSSFVTIQNCVISNTGTAYASPTTLGTGSGIRIYAPLGGGGVLRDIIVSNNSFAYQAAGVVVSENVSINHGFTDQFIIEGNDFNEHTSNVIHFIEEVSNVSADSGKIKNVVIRNNNLRNNKQTTSALGSSIPINLLKGTQDLSIENVGIYSVARVASSLHQVQLRPQFQGTTANTSVKDVRLVRDADNNGFAVGLYIHPQNTGATYGTASNFSSMSNVTVDGLYARNYYSALIADQFVDGPVTVKNSNNLRSTAEEASFIVQPGNVINATMFGCPLTATPHIFDNNYTGVATNILGYKRVLTVTMGSNIATVTDPTCSRSNNIISNSVIGKTGFVGSTPLGVCTTEAASSYDFNANAPISTTAEFQFYDSDAERTTSSYLINTFETATITNHQANSLNVTTSADVPVGSYTTIVNAIAASSAGNKIRGFENGITYSTFSVDKDLTFVISGSDRTDSPAKVTFENLTIVTGQTLTLKGDMWTTNNLTINGTLDLNGYALVVNGAIVYGASGSIKGGTAGSSIIYNSSSNSDLKMTPSFTSLDLLVMNGSGTLTLENNVTVTKQVRTAAGTIALNGFTLTIEGSGINPTGGSIDASVASSAIALNTAYPVSLANIIGSELILTRSIAGDVIAPGSSIYASIDLLGGNYGLTSGSTLVLSESSNFSGIGTIYATGTSTIQVNYATTQGAAPNLFGFGIVTFTGAGAATLGDITAPASGLTVNYNSGAGAAVLGDITGNLAAVNFASDNAMTLGNISGTGGAITYTGNGNATIGTIGGNVTSITINSASTTNKLTLTGAVNLTGAYTHTQGVLATDGNFTANGAVTYGTGRFEGGPTTAVSVLGNLAGTHVFPAIFPNYIASFTTTRGTGTLDLGGETRLTGALTATGVPLRFNGQRVRAGSIAGTGTFNATVAGSDLYLTDITTNYTIPFVASSALDTLSIITGNTTFLYTLNNNLTSCNTIINTGRLTLGTGVATITNVNHGTGTLTTVATRPTAITNLTVNSGTFTAGSALATLTNLTMNGGTFTTGRTITTAGTWNISAGTFTGAHQVTTTGTININGGTYQTNSSIVIAVTNPGMLNLSSGSLTLGNGSVVNGTGGFNMTGSSTLTVATAAGITALGTGTGSVQTSGSRVFSTTGNYIFNTTSGSPVTGTGLPSTVNNFSHGTTAGNLTLTNDLTVNGTFARSSGANNLALNGKRLTYAGTDASAMFLTGTTSSKLSLLGSSGDVTITMSGTGAAGTVNDLVVNRTGGATITIATRPLIVGGTSGTLALTSGVINTTSAADLELAAGASYTGGSTTSYINGPMRKTGTTAFTFPVGKSGRYNRIGITAPSASSTFSAEYFWHASNDLTTPFGATLGAGVAAKATKEYWDLTRSTGTGTAFVTLFWSNGTFSNIQNLSDLRVLHFTGGTWTSMGGTGAGTLSSGSILATTVNSSFSPFTFGSENGDNPLPVTLTKFTGRNVNGQANLFWTTAAELNNSGFEIMKSTDGKNWSVVGFVKGIGNSNKLNNYAFTDANLVYNSFYKLRQIDFDGKTTDSKSITINANATELSAVAYPNPFNNSLSLTIAANKTEKGKVTVFNLVGKVVSEMEVNLVNGANITELELANLPAGVYTVRVNQTNEVATLKVVKK